MKCEFDRELLSMYGDGALDLNRTLRVREHLSECEDCRTELRVYRELGSALCSIPRERAPEQLIARILANENIHGSTTGLGAFKLTAGAICSAGIHGFEIGEERERMLRRELPGWITRWVLFA